MTQGRDKPLPRRLAERPPQPLPALRGCGQSDVGMVTSPPVSPSSASCCDKEARRSRMGPCGLPQLKNRRESGGLGTGWGGWAGWGLQAPLLRQETMERLPWQPGEASLGLQAESGRRCPKKGRLGAGHCGGCSQSSLSPAPPPQEGLQGLISGEDESSLCGPILQSLSAETRENGFCQATWETLG